VAEKTGKTRILVADDDPQMRRLIRSILERDGFEITEAADGLDALESVESHPVDLMVLDIDMPRLDGLGVLEELRARVSTSAVPVIVLTARADDTEARVLDLGAQDFLAKPLQPQSLLARVKAVLRRTKMT
jgi:DNA-binding response OmpR family regulator